MKRICILLLLPVQVFAQVSMNVTPFDINSPADEQMFMRLGFESHEPVRINECTIEFEDDYIFDFADCLALHQDGNPLPVLSHASEFLYNPWLHYPSVYVGLGEDTTVSLDYVIDMYQYYPYDLDVSITCVIDYYADSNTPDTVIGPMQSISNVVLDVAGKDFSDVLSVKNISGGLSINVAVRFCEPFLLVDATGRVVEVLYTSKEVYVLPGVYALYGSEFGFVGKYVVQ